MNSVLNDIDNNANAYEYCVNKAVPDGSNFYYATLFETPENKIRLITFHAFLNELYEVIYECKDPGVARIKLKWWQEEIKRLFNQQARHPVTRQMQQCINIDKTLQSSFDSVIDCFNHYIFIEQTDSLGTILALYKSTSGKIWRQCHQQFNNNNKLDVASELGALIHYLNCLQQPHTYINETRCIIPANIIENIELQKLLVDTDNRQQLQKETFTPLISELKTSLLEIQQELKEKQQDLIYDLIMSKLAIKTCDEILADDCQLLDRNISLTPIRKFWIAWLTRTFR
jgi:phytoene synthase